MYMMMHAGKVKVIVKQTQKGDKVFKLPLQLIFIMGQKKFVTKYGRKIRRYIYFQLHEKPDLVNVDGDKIFCWNKKDNKTLDNFIHQYKYAGNYLDRREAIEFASQKQDDPKALESVKNSIEG